MQPRYKHLLRFRELALLNHLNRALYQCFRIRRLLRRGICANNNTPKCHC